MARVPLMDESDDAETQALIDTLKKGRRGSLLGIYKALLQIPNWRARGSRISTRCAGRRLLSGRLREILIIRIGWRLRAPTS